MRFTALPWIFLCFSSVYAEEGPNFPKPRRITLRHIESGGIGYTSGYTTLEAFLSKDPTLSKLTPFFDGRGHIFDNGDWAANGGIGLRQEFKGRIYGINAYYDYRGTKRLNYNQVSVGLETLGALVDARLNGYLPFSKKVSSPYDTEFSYFSGHSLFLSQKVEVAMKGVDGEIGFHLGSCDSYQFYTAAGPYYLRGKQGPNAWGGKVRASFGYRDWVTLEVVDSYDNVFHNKIQGQISFSIPLGPKEKKIRTETLYCRQLQPVARNEIIPLNHEHIYPIAIDPLTNAPYYFVFVKNTSSSDGTFESPYPSLSLAQNNSAPYQIIYTFPGDGTTRNMDLGITLQPYQKFWGSGIAHYLETAQGGVTIPQMSATAPQITNTTLLGSATVLSTYNEVSGITFTQTSGQGIKGVDSREVTLSNCTFTTCGQGDLGIFPVVLQSNSPLKATILNNTFTSNTNGGVYVQLLTEGASGQIVMNNNQAYSNLGNSGGASLLNIEGHSTISSCQVTMANNTFQNNECGGCNITDFDSPHEGSFTSFQGTFTGNTITGNSQGITFSTNAETCALTIQGNNLSNNTHGSILVTAGAAGTQQIRNGTLIIDSNQINNGGNQGDAITISPSGNNLSITISNNSISNNTGTGFVSYINSPYPNTTLYITNNTITYNQNTVNFNASSGISFDGFNTLSAVIQGNTFNNNATGGAGPNSLGSYTTSPSTSTVSFTNNQLSGGDTFNFTFSGNAPATSCLTITGNTSTTDPTYTFTQGGTGSCFIVPCSYETQNTGGFNLSGTTASSDCLGTSCP